MILKRIAPLSMAKIMGIMYAALGLLAGIFISMLSLAGVFASSMLEDGPGSLVGMFIGVGAIIFLPILYGILGFIMGAVAALLYNLFARIVGGVEFEFEEKAPIVQP